MAAMTVATGARSWVASRRWSWLTPGRVKRATVLIFAVALVLSTVTLTGSGSSG